MSLLFVECKWLADTFLNIINRGKCFPQEASQCDVIRGFRVRLIVCRCFYVRQQKEGSDARHAVTAYRHNLSLCCGPVAPSSKSPNPETFWLFAAAATSVLTHVLPPIADPNYAKSSPGVATPKPPILLRGDGVIWEWPRLVIHFSLWESFINTCWTITRWQGSDDCLLAPVTLLCWSFKLRGIPGQYWSSRSSRPQPFGHLYVYCFNDLLPLLKTYRRPIRRVPLQTQTSTFYMRTSFTLSARFKASERSKTRQSASLFYYIFLHFIIHYYAKNYFTFFTCTQTIILKLFQKKYFLRI